MSTKNLSDSIKRSSGHHELRAVQKFKRSVRSKVDEDETIESKIHSWKDGPSMRGWGVIKKVLKAAVGRKWDDVYSEICEDVKDPEIRDYFIRALDNVYEKDGMLYLKRLWYGDQPLTECGRDVIYLDAHGIIQCYTGYSSKTKYIPNTTCILTPDGVFFIQSNLYYKVPLSDCWFSRESFLNLSAKYPVNLIHPTDLYAFSHKYVTPVKSDTAARMGYIFGNRYQIPDFCFRRAAKRQMSSKEIDYIRAKYPEIDRIKNQVT